MKMIDEVVGSCDHHSGHTTLSIEERNIDGHRVLVFVDRVEKMPIHDRPFTETVDVVAVLAVSCSHIYGSTVKMLQEGDPLLEAVEAAYGASV